jgi:hypothetical protein
VRAGVVLVGTLWPEEYNAVAVLRRPGPGDTQASIREVLNLAQVLDVAPTFSTDELHRAQELSRTDPRLRVALDSAEVGTIQVLAAGPALVRWWEQGTDPYGVSLITAAVDARRLGVEAPLTRKFLAEAAVHYLSPAHRDLRRGPGRRRHRQ